MFGNLAVPLLLSHMREAKMTVPSRCAGRLRCIAWLLLPGACLAQTADLKTRDTQIALEAGANAPRLATLQEPTGPKWENQVSESLIKFVQIDEQEMQVTWQFNREASSIGEKRVTFVYESADPHLRLTWSWAAKEDYGPLEHQIRIENLTSQELWMPMQDSF